MDPMLIISPHLDDAVLSAGQLMAGRPDCQVATVCTGTPRYGNLLTSYDRSCGFGSASEAMTTRRAEDDAALALLNATSVHHGFLDHQYREVVTDHDTAPPGWWERTLADQLLALMRHVTQVIGPLGLAHPDHQMVANAYALALRTADWVEAWVYEDMPSRVLWPEQVPQQVAWWRYTHGWAMELGFLGTGPEATKAAAIDCYQSQLWALDRHCVLVPERHHLLVRP